MSAANVSSGRRRITISTISAAVVVAVMLACIGSLPYTLGRVEAIAEPGMSAAGSSARRYEAIDSDRALLPPSWAHHTPSEREQISRLTQNASPGGTVRWGGWLGTDRLGRSVLVRVLAGGAISMGIGFAAAAVSVVIGTLYGAIAGSRGGRVDAVMMRIVDVLFCLPYILLVVLLAVAVNGLIERVDERAYAAGSDAPKWLMALQGNRAALNILTLLVAIGGVSWLSMARVIRGQVLSLKQQPFMEACRAIGVPPHRQFLRHLLPNLAGPIIVYATLTVPTAILSESFLSFLGIGVQEPLPSWGNLASAGLSELNLVRSRWWLLLWPCLAIALTLLALNFVGEGLRERFDPRRTVR